MTLVDSTAVILELILLCTADIGILVQRRGFLVHRISLVHGSSLVLML
jgi:hypothetical protein